MNPRAITNYVRTVGFTVGLSAYVVVRQMIRQDPEVLQRHTRAWARGVAWSTGLEVRAFGTWRLDPAGTYVFMANHQSLLDVPALFNALPMVPGFLAKAELRRVPAFGRAMAMGGHVFVDRGKHERAVEAIREAAKDLREGGSIVIFPEGTRSPRPEVLPFKKGGFHLAKQARVPIVPVGIRGTGDALPKGSLEVYPARAEIHVGEIIGVDEVDAFTLEGLIEHVRHEVGALSALPLV